MLEPAYKKAELIVMLTHNDRTAKNAYEIFQQCKNSKAKYWGLKGDGLSFGQMKNLYAYMKEYGKTTILEITSYTEEKCLEGAKIAAECGCDILMGTLFFDCVNEFCKQNNLKYMPFVGKVTGVPSILEGNIDEMINEANECLRKGVFGIDLLGYRYLEDTVALIKKFTSQVKAPICIAGSINSYQRLDEVMSFTPWAFTIGGAFFENRFGETHKEQVDNVCEYIDAYCNRLARRM